MLKFLVISDKYKKTIGSQNVKNSGYITTYIVLRPVLVFPRCWPPRSGAGARSRLVTSIDPNPTDLRRYIRDPPWGIQNGHNFRPWFSFF